MISLTVEIDTIEINGEDSDLIESPKIKIQSHWNYDNRVIIVTPDGNSYTVFAKDIITAVTKASD